MNFSKVLSCRQFMGAVKSGNFKTPAAWVRPMSGHSYQRSDHKPFHYDEMPVPEGKWEDLYNKDQRKYNTQLAVGVTFLALTLYYITTSGVVFFNASYPPLPELQEEQEKK